MTPRSWEYGDCTRLSGKEWCRSAPIKSDIMATGKFTVLAGDFATGPNVHMICGDNLQFQKKDPSWRMMFNAHEKVPVSQIASIEVASEETAKSFAGAATAGLAGGLLLGPVGAIAGLLACGNSSSVTFVLTLRDGRRALCTAKSNVFQMFQKLIFVLDDMATDSNTPRPENAAQRIQNDRDATRSQTSSERNPTAQKRKEATGQKAGISLLIGCTIGIIVATSAVTIPSDHDSIRAERDSSPEQTAEHQRRAILDAIKLSDDFDSQQDVLLRASYAFLKKGGSIADLHENGGWVRSQKHKPREVYFCYRNSGTRFYFDTRTGVLFQ